MSLTPKRLYFILRNFLGLNYFCSVFSCLNKPVVFCYHQIDSIEFEDHVVFLKKSYDILDMKSFLKKMDSKTREKICTITLDDCLEEDVDKIIPICIKHNIPLTFFLPVRFSINQEALPGTYLQQILQKVNCLIVEGHLISVNGNNRTKFAKKVNDFFNIKDMKTAQFESKISQLLFDNKLTKSDVILDKHKVISIARVNQISENPLFNFQSHTFNHETLGMCSSDEIKDEFSVSKAMLQDITRNEVYAICYPYGSEKIVGTKVFNLVSNDYQYGFSLIQGVCNNFTNRFFIPRIAIYPGDDVISFSGKLNHYLMKDLLKKYF